MLCARACVNAAVCTAAMLPAVALLQTH
jgi:hypothetical protein